MAGPSAAAGRQALRRPSARNLPTAGLTRQDLGLITNSLTDWLQLGKMAWGLLRPAIFEFYDFCGFDPTDPASTKKTFNARLYTLSEFASKFPNLDWIEAWMELKNVLASVLTAACNLKASLLSSHILHTFLSLNS